MDRLLQQKKKGEQTFRLKINEFISKSPYARKQQQLTPQILTQLLQSTLFEPALLPNGRYSIQKLSSILCPNDHSARQFMRVMSSSTPRRQLKPAQIHNILKSYQLHEFDLQEQLQKYLFDGQKMQIRKVQELMRSVGMGLNEKDREILVECFDFDGDGIVGREDLRVLVGLCGGESSSGGQRKVEESGNGGNGVFQGSINNQGSGNSNNSKTSPVGSLFRV